MTDVSSLSEQVRDVAPELLRRWRDATPGCANRAHLNNAGAALMPRPVSDAIHSHLSLESEIGGYEAADMHERDIQQVYDDVAQLVNAGPRNVAVTASATAAFIQAITSFDLGSGDIIVTSRSDYTSYQIQYLALAKRAGVRVIHAADLPEGGIDPQSVREILRRARCKIVSVSWVPTHSGLVQDVASVSAVCEEAGVSYHVDACQAVGQVAVDFAALRCDYLSATARKFLRGPRGVGFLVASDRALARGDYPLFVDMRGAEWTAPTEFSIASTAKRYEDWEFAYALVLGLGAAVRYALAQGIEPTAARAWSLAAYMRERLSEIPGVRILDRGRVRSAIVTFDSSALSADKIMEALAARHVNVVLTRKWIGLLDFGPRGVELGIRASPHYYNTIEEIDRLVDTVAEVASA
jgi:selenocysteine lyase/cysteine desulfurase